MEQKTIGERIRAAREKRRLSQDELALRMGGLTKAVHISRYETGRCAVRSVTIAKIIAALDGCTWQEIFGND